MSIIAKALVALVALIHIYIAWFEIFAWTSRGPAVFDSLPPDIFEPTIKMAANQGLSTPSLPQASSGLFVITDKTWRRNIATCFLVFVAVAGVLLMSPSPPKPSTSSLAPALMAILAVWFMPKPKA